MVKSWNTSARKAFTLVELIVVIVILGILAAVAIPKFADASTKAKESTVRSTLATVRNAIANFSAMQALNAGASRWPTGTELTTNGTVMQETIPSNPYNSVAGVTSATATKGTVTGTTTGWQFNTTTGEFWANSNVAGENAW